jgi:hypothetical protein
MRTAALHNVRAHDLGTASTWILMTASPASMRRKFQNVITPRFCGPGALGGRNASFAVDRANADAKPRS